jgi:hypothetical protein
MDAEIQARQVINQTLPMHEQRAKCEVDEKNRED